MGHSVRVASLSDRSTFETWTRLRNKLATATPFSNPDLVLLAWQTFGADPEVLVVENGSNVGALCIFFESSKGPFRRAGLAPLFPFTPIVLHTPVRQSDVNQRRSVLDALERFVRQQWHNTRIHLPPYVDDPRTFIWSGWDVSPLFTPVGTLPDCSDLSKWSKGTAQLVESHATQFTISAGSENINEILHLVEDSYERNSRRMPASVPTIASLIQKLTPLGLALPYLARSRKSERAEAGIIALKDDDHACYWLAGSLKGPAMTVLISRLLNDLSNLGCRSIDFVGANTPGIAEFKRHFNTKLESYYACKITTSKILGATETVRRIIQRS